MDEVVPLPDLDGLRVPDCSLRGVVISHGHYDHYGLATQLGGDVPVYVGAATERMLREARFFSPAGADLRPAGHLVDGVPLELGPFTVTPLLADHSAFDAYSLVVDAGGRRLYYSGDLRSHGRKRTFERLIAHPPAGVDVTLLEGTRIIDDGRSGLSEHEYRLAELMASTSGMVLAAYSPQNIDRLVTIYRAAKRSGRLVVMDLYASAVAAATGRATIPQADWDGVRVYVPQAQRLKFKRAGAFDRVAAVRESRLYPEQLRDQASGLVITFRGSMVRELERADCVAGASLAWLMWGGYFDGPSSASLRSWLERLDIPCTSCTAPGARSSSPRPSPWQPSRADPHPGA